MTKFLLKTFFILTVLLFGIVFGIHHANEGTLSLFGKNDVVETTVEATPSPSPGKVEAEPVEQLPIELTNKEQAKDKPEVTTKELLEKQQRATDVGAFNFYSELGSSIGDILEMIVSHTVSAITGLIHGWLNK
ncbi:hypothetical protein BTR23_11460 [Alkalihalophilus pseudofirmus]|nr:hypothetical protein BTR23_11460 [Alkalihalophilus pseudofirmus]